MSITRIIRPPSILSTPKRLADAISSLQSIHCQILRYPNRYNPVSDLRLFYSEVRNIPDSDRSVYSFFMGNKAYQRKKIQAEGLPTVPCATTQEEYEQLESPTEQYLFRPFRHRGGSGYTISSRTDTPFPDFSQFYVQPTFKKKREFRVITSFGEPIVLLRKSIPEGLSPLQPWNHLQGSSFITINNLNNFFPGESFLQQLRQSVLLKQIDLVGIDVIQDYNNNNYILEFNSCPSLNIEENVNKVAEYLVNHERFNRS